jgi:hypothetical protein
MYTSNADAEVIVVDEPPTNATEELDIKIDATEPLPLNGTIMVDVAEADDMSIFLPCWSYLHEELAPAGVDNSKNKVATTTKTPKVTRANFTIRN